MPKRPDIPTSDLTELANRKAWRKGGAKADLELIQFIYPSYWKFAYPSRQQIAGIRAVARRVLINAVIGVHAYTV